MKDKLLLLYICFAILSISCFSLLAATGKIYLIEGSDNLDGNYEAVEDSLLLDALEMSSEDLNKNIEEGKTSETGEIIYDDSFIEAETSEAIKTVSKKKSKNTKNDLLSELRKKDSRWHITQHTIKKGESIWTIAKKFGVNHKIIISYNTILSPDSVRVGKNISVPNKRGFEYTVKKGDTLSEIAYQFKIQQSTITKLNHSGTKIKIGQKIFLPDAAMPKVIPLIEKGSTRSKMVAAAEPNVAEPKSKPVKNKRFIWPLHGQITSGFGMRTHPISGQTQFHNGIDIRSALKTDVRATDTGIVIYRAWKDGYGKLLVIKHSDNYISVYAHLNAYKVKLKQKVRRGDVIARSGNTGLSTGPHLHFEIRKYETPLNPLRMIR